MTAVPEVDVVTDAELAVAAAAGDRAAFAGIYDRYADRLYDFCVGMVRDRNAAADCVQDTFCTAATRLASLREPDKLRPWLYAIARNEALRCIRERRREEPSDELPEASSSEPSPDTLAARSELAELVAQAAGGLSDRDRTVLELTYRHGLDGPELAEALGVSAASARTLTHRLRETVERSLGALLVMRTAKAGHGCMELATSMKDWDGQFTVLTRKRVARHIDSCLTCEASRRQMVSRQALLGAAPVFIPAPDELRQRTLDNIQLCSASSALTGPAAGVGAAAAGGADPSAAIPSSPSEADEAQSATLVVEELPLPGGAAPENDPGDDERRRRRGVLALFLLLALALIAALWLSLAWPSARNAPPEPAGVTQTSSRSAPPSAATPTPPAPTSIAPPPAASTTVPAVAPSPTYQQPVTEQFVPPAPPPTAPAATESEIPSIASIRPTPPRSTATVLPAPRATSPSTSGNQRSNPQSGGADSSGSNTAGGSSPSGGTSGGGGGTSNPAVDTPGTSDTSGGTSGPAGQPGPGSTAPPR